MKTYKLIIGCSVLLALSYKGRCQETALSLNLAENAYEHQEYLRAARLFEKVEEFHVIRFYKVPEDVPGKLASCYRELKDYPNATRWYKKITNQSPHSIEGWIGLGDVLKCQGRYEEAKAAYHHVPDSIYRKIQNRVDGCDSAEIWLNAPTNYFLTNLAAVNTPGSDWGAVPYGGHGVVYTSDSNRAGGLYQKVYMMDSTAAITGFSSIMNENIYHDGAVTFNRGGDTAYFSVTNPSALKAPGEKASYRQGSHLISVRYRRLEIWWTVKDSAGNWGPAQSFVYNNSARYSVGQAALAPDGHILYFTSDMPGGYGRTDIWYCEKMPDGSWSAPVNCGPSVNTSEEDAFPYVGPDGVLYFASKGHTGMGGFDVFRAEGEKADWKEVSNMKYPVNSSADDFYFIAKDSLSGFVSSDRPGGKGGDDIYTYAAKLPGGGAPGSPDFSVTSTVPGTAIVPGGAIAGTPAGSATGSAGPGSATGANPGVATVASPAGANPGVATVASPAGATGANPGGSPDALPGGATVSWTPPPPIVLKTKVLDKLTRQPLEGAEILVSTAFNNFVRHGITNSAGMSFDTLTRNEHFNDSASKSGYIPVATHISSVGITGSDTVTATIFLEKRPAKGDVIVLRNVYFDLNKWNIRTDATDALDGVVAYMKEYPTMTIDLSAHTDSRGNDAYNLALSIRRARSARRYMAQHGIALHRISIHGYGETRLTNACRNGVPCTEEEHQANRRVEVKVVHQ